MLRTVVFDLGNVLLQFSHDRMCANIGALCGVPAAEVRRLIFDSGLQWRFERGEFSEAEFHAQWQQASGRTCDPGAFARAGGDIFWPVPGSQDIVRDLKSHGLKLVALSNTSITHYQHVRQNFTVLDAFDERVLSFEVKAQKPDERIYRAALEKIGCHPSECFYTDDIPEYVEAGRRLGLHAEVFTEPSALRRHLHALGALPGDNS